MKPCRIALVGGGRWARVYARVLSRNPDSVRSVTIVSPRNADGMRRWIATEGLPYEVTAAHDPIGFDAAIIANAAADHEAWAERYLEARVPVLIEKPFATRAAGAARLIDLAQARNVYLAAALVFKFARYLDRFAALLPDRWDGLSVTWTDPRDESRHGGRKSYDPSVPVAADVLPHVVSILDALAPGARITCRSVAVRRGGAQTDIELSLNGRPCVVHLSRNAEMRVRVFAVVADGQKNELDFSVEPGRITRNGEGQSGDSDWGKGPSPLTQLMRSFLEGVATGARDHRLDPKLGLLACRVTDEVLRHYDTALAATLRMLSDRGILEKDDLDYAVAELGPEGIDPDQPSIDQLIVALKRRAESR